jgi:hypothetical protein
MSLKKILWNLLIHCKAFLPMNELLAAPIHFETVLVLAFGEGMSASPFTVRCSEPSQ